MIVFYFSYWQWTGSSSKCSNKWGITAVQAMTWKWIFKFVFSSLFMETAITQFQIDSYSLWMFKDLYINSFHIWLYNYVQIYSTLRINTSLRSYVVMVICHMPWLKLEKFNNMVMRKKNIENSFYEKCNWRSIKIEPWIWWTRSKSTTGTEQLCMHSTCRKISCQEFGLI